MSAPLSPRTEAILRAVELRPAGVDVATLVDTLDRDAPDSRWPGLSLADRRSTVRRYLGRLADDGRVARLDEGLFGPSRRSSSADASRSANLDATASASSPVRGDTSVDDSASSKRTQAQTKRGLHDLEPESDTPAAQDGSPDEPAAAARRQRESTRLTPTPEPERVERRRAHHEQTSTLSDPENGPGAPAAGTTDPAQEGIHMTVTTESPTPVDAHDDARPLASLLDNCPAGPWPPCVHERLAVVEELDSRRVDLVSQRDAALRAADVAEAAESDAIVDGDGDDTGTHAVEASRQRDAAARLERALATLNARRHAATLDVLAAQEQELLDRTRAALAAVAEHWRRREQLIDDLVEHDGTHWRAAAGQSVNQSRNQVLRSEADRAARRVLAVRAVIDDLPLGFIGPGAQTVTRSGLGTLTGVSGVAPLVDSTTISVHDHGRDTTELVEALEAELTQAPMP